VRSGGLSGTGTTCEALCTTEESGREVRARGEMDCRGVAGRGRACSGNRGGGTGGRALGAASSDGPELRGPFDENGGARLAAGDPAA